MTFGARTILETKSRRLVGKLGDRTDFESITASNRDIQEGGKGKAEETRRETSEPEERERKHEKDMRREKTEYRE